MNMKELLAVAFAGCLILLAGCASSSGAPSTAAKTYDAQVREQVRESIRDEPFLSGANIAVTVSNGTVYLHGTVKRGADISIAQSAAERVEGVFDVVNNLTD